MRDDEPPTACPWLVRDREGWRAGVLMSASADFLTAWHTAAPPAEGVGPYADLVARVGAARAAGHPDALAAACAALVAAGDRGLPRALRAALSGLADMLGFADDPRVCLIDCGRCEEVPSPVADGP